jgi:molybdopterin converting factor small subunit
MSVDVRIPVPMRQHTEGKKVVSAAGDTLAAVLDDLVKQYPGLKDRLFDGGQVRRMVNFSLNGEDVRFLDNLAAKTKSGDELEVILSVAGG